MRTQVYSVKGENDMGDYEETVYEDQGIYVKHRILHTKRAGTIENYRVAREPHSIIWIGPFHDYNEAVAFLLPMRSIYRMVANP